MPMHLGTLGTITVTLGDPAVNILAELYPSRWSIDYAQDAVEAIKFGPTNNYPTVLGGIHRVSGTAEGFSDDTHAIDLSSLEIQGGTAAFVLTAHTGRTFTFDGVITGFSQSAASGEYGTWTMSFTASTKVTVA